MPIGFQWANEKEIQILLYIVSFFLPLYSVLKYIPQSGTLGPINQRFKTWEPSRNLYYKLFRDYGSLSLRICRIVLVLQNSCGPRLSSVLLNSPTACVGCLLYTSVLDGLYKKKLYLSCSKGDLTTTEQNQRIQQYFLNFYSCQCSRNLRTIKRENGQLTLDFEKSSSSVKRGGGGGVFRARMICVKR